MKYHELLVKLEKAYSGLSDDQLKNLLNAHRQEIDATGAYRQDIMFQSLGRMRAGEKPTEGEKNTTTDLVVLACKYQAAMITMLKRSIALEYGADPTVNHPWQ